MNLYEKLKNLQHQLCVLTAKRYKYNDLLVDIFSYENLISISNEIILEMSNSQDIDSPGIYNYFRKAFSYKCQDLYRKFKTQKRKHNSVALDQVNEPHVESFIEEELSKKDFLLEIKHFLKKKERESNTPYLTVFDFICLGYTLKEISAILKTSESSVKKIKTDFLLMLNKEFSNVKQNYFLEENFEQLIIYEENIKDQPTITQYIIELIYNSSLHFSIIKLVMHRGDKSEDLIVKTNENAEEHQKSYLYIKEELKKINI